MSNYKKHKVVMLPTDKKPTIGDIVVNTLMPDEIALTTREGVYVEDIYRFGASGITFRRYEQKGLQPQHLYILSDEKIKESDWYLWKNGNDQIIQANNLVSFHDSVKHKYSKVIASTDPSLGLPGLSPEFLKQYCAAGGIAYVEVEYELMQTTPKENYQYSNGSSNLNYEYRLSVFPEGNIISKPQAVVERTFTKADMEFAWNAGCFYTDSPVKNGTLITFKDWFSKNY